MIGGITFATEAVRKAIPRLSHLSLSLSGDAAVAQLVASRELLAQCRTSKDSGKATSVGSGGLYCTEDQNATFCGNMTLWKTLTTC